MLKRAVAKAVAQAFIMVGAFALPFLFISPEPGQPPVSEPVITPASLLAENDCWTSEAPADVEVPGHVVVTKDGQPRLGGSRLVGKALEQIFEGQEHNLTVHGFCR